MTNNILLNSTDMEPNMIQLKETGKEILTIHADGRITVSEDCKPTETAAEVLRIMRDQWLSDVQCAKIRELQSDVTQLENRLRALWDKLEYERKHYMEQINRTESFINRFLDPEDLGYTVNNYVRDDAREALGRERVEAKP